MTLGQQANQLLYETILDSLVVFDYAIYKRAFSNLLAVGR